MLLTGECQETDADNIWKIIVSRDLLTQLSCEQFMVVYLGMLMVQAALIQYDSF